MVAAIVPLLRGYQLLEQIGTGGLGAVYRARQMDLEREVAIKIIPPDFANQPDFIRRFETEAHLIARLEHRHIVPLYDYWRDADGAYLVMQLFRGGSLRDRLKQGPLELEPALRQIEQIADALDYAHRNRVIHLDIKPSNILLDEDGNAYLSDFGIVGIVQGKTTRHQAEGISGSLEYVPPEQIKSQRLSPQSDIYSLGLVLYEMLTGEHAFQGSTSSGVIDRHLETQVPDAHLRRADLPVAVSVVIRRATARDPSERYPDALQLAVALRETVPQAAIHAPIKVEMPPPPVEELTPP